MNTNLISTQDNLCGYKILKNLGITRGNTVRSRNIASNIFASLQSIFGGEIDGYSKMVNDAREEAYQRMIKHAKSLDGNAIVGVRFITSDVAGIFTEIVCYGTAVLVEEDN